jgi:hypothetical protein
LDSLVLGLAAAGCAAPEPAGPASPPVVSGPTDAVTDSPAPPRDLAAELAQLEARLLADGYAVRYTVEAQGAARASIQGLLTVGQDRVTLKADGSFADTPIAIALQSDGERMRADGGKLRLDLPTAPALAEALSVGLTRMGILHNIAVLMGGRAPDHAEGGVQTWVVARDFTAEPVDAGFEAPATGRPLSFEIVVAKERAGRATLFVDDTDHPIVRHQVVDFPGGEMRVRETYDWSPL